MYVCIGNKIKKSRKIFLYYFALIFSHTFNKENGVWFYNKSIMLTINAFKLSYRLHYLSLILYNLTHWCSLFVWFNLCFVIVYNCTILFLLYICNCNIALFTKNDRNILKRPITSLIKTCQNCLLSEIVLFLNNI